MVRARAVHERVGRAAPRLDRVNQRRARGRIGDVGAHGEGRSARGLEVAEGAGSVGVARAVADRDGVAALGEPERDAAADAARAAGDERDAAAHGGSSDASLSRA